MGKEYMLRPWRYWSHEKSAFWFASVYYCGLASHLGVSGKTWKTIRCYIKDVTEHKLCLGQSILDQTTWRRCPSFGSMASFFSENPWSVDGVFTSARNIRENTINLGMPCRYVVRLEAENGRGNGTLEW